MSYIYYYTYTYARRYICVLLLYNYLDSRLEKDRRSNEILGENFTVKLMEDTNLDNRKKLLE